MRVFASLFNGPGARFDTASAFVQLFAKRWPWGAMALPVLQVMSVLLQVAVVQIGRLNLAFSTAPLTFQQWAVCAAMASGVLWFSKLHKAFSCGHQARP